MNGSVYIGTIAGHAGLKIGRSIDPEQRAKAITQFSEGKFVILHSEAASDEKAVENAAHWELREKHIVHEWFDVTVDDAKAAITVAIDKVSRGIHPPFRVGVSKPYSVEPRDITVATNISASDMAALDAWRQKHAVWSRSEAIRQAIQKMVASAKP